MIVSYESIWRWCMKFGQAKASVGHRGVLGSVLRVATQLYLNHRANHLLYHALGYVRASPGLIGKRGFGAVALRRTLPTRHKIDAGRIQQPIAPVMRKAKLMARLECKSTKALDVQHMNVVEEQVASLEKAQALQFEACALSFDGSGWVDQWDLQSLKATCA